MYMERFVAITRVINVSYGADGQPNGCCWFGQVIDRDDPQKPLDTCEHLHRTEKAALSCARRMLRARITALLEEPDGRNDGKK
jgi:hypothetical protein